MEQEITYYNEVVQWLYSLSVEESREFEVDNIQSRLSSSKPVLLAIGPRKRRP